MEDKKLTLKDFGCDFSSPAIPEKQVYMDELLGNLVKLKSYGNQSIAASLVNNLLAQEKQSLDYVLAKYGHTDEAIRPLLKGCLTGKYSWTDKHGQQYSTTCNVGHKYLENNFKKFKDLSSDSFLLIWNDSDFCNHSSIRKELLLNSLKKFQKLDQKVAMELVQEKDLYYEGHHFSGIDRVFEHLHDFENINISEIYKYVKTLEEDLYFFYVLEYFDFFKEVGIKLAPKELCKKIINTGNTYLLANYADLFKDFDYQKFITRKIRRYEYLDGNFIKNIDTFPNVDKSDIVRQILDLGQRYVHKDKDSYYSGVLASLLKDVDTFSNVNKNDIAREMLNLDWRRACKGRNYDYSKVLAKNLKYFKQLDKDILERLLQHGQERTILDNPDGLAVFGLTMEEFKTYLIEYGRWSSIAYNLERFSGFDEKIALKLINEGYGGYVRRMILKNPEYFMKNVNERGD